MYGYQNSESYQGLVGLYAWDEGDADSLPEKVGRIVGWRNGDLVVLRPDGTVVMRSIHVRCLPDSKMLMRATPGEQVTVEHPRPKPMSIPGGGWEY